MHLAAVLKEDGDWAVVIGALVGALILAFVVDRALSRRTEQLAAAVTRGQMSRETATRLRFVRRVIVELTHDGARLPHSRVRVGLGRGGNDGSGEGRARMLTADEIAGIAIFESLTEPQRDRLARIAADLRPNAGEIVIHTGDERALYAVLEGSLETVALVDGIERIVGGRAAGELIGEVPISLGTTFPFSFRATEASRVMRISAADYHAVVAASPEVGQKLEGDEDLTIERYSFDELHEMIRNGEIEDAKTIVGITMADFNHREHRDHGE